MTHEFQDWIGRSERVTEHVGAEQSARLAALLDAAPLREGDPLPPLWHWAYFTPRASQSELGADGHPRLGGFLPPIPLPRRMWAGGRLRFHAPLKIGDSATRETEIVSLQEKQGKQGRLFFLTLRHRLFSGEDLAIEEEQDIVYKEPGLTAMPSPAESLPAAWRDRVAPDPTLLFRYSAVTFNAHRIHYDRPYATQEEGYPDVVVHGPLTATLLAWSLAKRDPRPLAEFSFRGKAPLFCGGAFDLCAQPLPEAGAYDLWAEGPGHYVAMSARAVTAA